jgi:hypothetical protein
MRLKHLTGYANEVPWRGNFLTQEPEEQCNPFDDFFFWLQLVCTDFGFKEIADMESDEPDIKMNELFDFINENRIPETDSGLSRFAGMPMKCWILSISV